MELTPKERFEEMENNLWRIRLNKERLLIKSDNYEEFVGLYNEAAFHLQRLQELEDLSTAYKRKEHLQKLYWERDQEFEKAKGKRTIFVFLGFTVAYYFLLWQIAEPTGIGIILEILPALFFAGIHFWVNALVFSWLNQKGRAEQDHLDYLKKEINELITKIADDPRPTEQKLDQIKQQFEDTLRRLENFPTD